MSEPQSNDSRPEPTRHDVPRRVVHESEYRTSYLDFYQVRMLSGLHDRLCRRASREDKPPADLVIGILEEAVHRRLGGSR